MWECCDEARRLGWNGMVRMIVLGWKTPRESSVVIEICPYCDKVLRGGDSGAA
jgi:hypothetical protein